MQKKDADILFEQQEWMFSYRIGGLLYRDGKLLLQREVGDDRYAIPGGHVAFGEYSQQTLARELSEETGAAVKVGRLCFMVELLWEWRKPCHQLNLFYLAQLKNPDALPKENFRVLDELGQEKHDLEFCWVDLKELSKIKLFPACLKPYLAELPDQIVHLQEKEWD
ncbi:MAG: NUDIX domain-containing protein [Clostridia bacterium]|nr:NUDIX domain-containing protein [Clostridia bacterium]MBQ7095593.1 NUDIX domain-containing protein [Clostridia bacterium]